jgi:hypothetical protein
MRTKQRRRRDDERAPTCPVGRQHSVHTAVGQVQNASSAMITSMSGSSAAERAGVSSAPGVVAAGCAPWSTSSSGHTPVSRAAPSRSRRPTSCAVVPAANARAIAAPVSRTSVPGCAPASIASMMIARCASARWGSSRSPAVPHEDPAVRPERLLALSA